MEKPILTQSIEKITNLIESQRIAESGRYRVVWFKDHFEVHKINNPYKESFLIIILQAWDINEGLSCAKWNTIESRLRVLIETGVIK